eukprot:CAMPEP_0168557328 /NCGR_PEP_ID=MMETSP0413-20121227/9367_1 /TAXON_ID=136452 /ORGANISM="Filamoeba nolandi, Strain NC-AS-23-1" /LENGTH=171 /DNA_ID=CAMNT_0008588353 /DNA_START=41 /DNA_END=559 /DNA_ORIENTATION=-
MTCHYCKTGCDTKHCPCKRDGTSCGNQCGCIGCINQLKNDPNDPNFISRDNPFAVAQNHFVSQYLNKFQNDRRALLSDFAPNATLQISDNIHETVEVFYGNRLCCRGLRSIPPCTFVDVGLRIKSDYSLVIQGHLRFRYQQKKEDASFENTITLAEQAIQSMVLVISEYSG